MADFETEKNHVGAGWQELIENTHTALTGLMPGYTISQIKEKFGGLRYYWVPPQDTDVKVINTAHQIVDNAEQMSFHICEWCGKPGTTKAHRGWLATLCEEHHEERKREVEQRYETLHRDLGGEG